MEYLITNYADANTILQISHSEAEEAEEAESAEYHSLVVQFLRWLTVLKIAFVCSDQSLKYGECACNLIVMLMLGVNHVQLSFKSISQSRNV